MQAEIITIGDELLIGQVLDTNSAYIAKALNAIGVEVWQMSSIHDDAEQIEASLSEALQKVRIVIFTGGLGPTKDDITKKTLCEYFGTVLVPNVEVERHVRELYKDRPAVLNSLTETQWLVPEKATILLNRLGSAPIMVFEEAGKVVISLPGIPKEMEAGIDEQVVPYLQAWLQRNGNTEQIRHINIMVEGIPESALALRIGAWEDNLPPHIHLAYLPNNGRITLRLSAYYEAAVSGQNEADLQQAVTELQELVRPFLIGVERFL